MASNPCPADHEVLALATGGTVPEWVRQHVDACADCRLRVDRFRAELSEVRQVAAELPDVHGAPTAPVAAPPDADTASSPSRTEPPDEESDLEEQEATEPPARPETIGRYRIVGELDSGGQASVYRAVHPTLPRDLAIKIAHQSSPIDHQQLRSDAELLCELDHPNLVRVHDLDVHDGRPFVVMEFIRGRNLQQVADQSRPRMDEAVAWISAIARALEYVHRKGVVHQDIKPKNIMLDDSGRPRLIDFGMARWRHAWSGRRPGPSGGTLAYMAPEQARGESQRVGAPSDIFTLGGVLYFLLTGKTPFGGGTRAQQWSRASTCDFDRPAMRSQHVPRRLERIVRKAMAPEPEKRFASADAMANALDAFAARPRRLGIRAGILLLAALAFGTWSLWTRPAREADRNARVDSTAQTKPNGGKAAPLVESPSSTQPPRIETFEVRRYHRRELLGSIGVNSFEAHYQDDDIRVRVGLDRPASCYLIALNPDGKTQLCYPEESTTAPPLSTMLEYPSDPRLGFGLTDGVGMQAFILIVSSQQLPPYGEWSGKLGVLPWKSVATEDVWRYDGRFFDHDVQRGDVRRLELADVPAPLEATCHAFEKGPGVEAIRALAFPVKPQQVSNTPQHPG